MSKYIIDSETLQDIADSIRLKTGKSATMTPLEMPDEIESISGGGGSDDYFYLENTTTENWGTFRIQITNYYVGDTSPYFPSFSYSADKVTWYSPNMSVSGSNMILTFGVYSVLGPSTKKVYIKNSSNFMNDNRSLSAPSAYCKFIGVGPSTITLKAGGRLMSLFGDIDGDTPPQNACYYLFNGFTALVDASALVFPANVSANCYHDMFNACTNLVHGPTSLPATTLAQGCYASMFYNCSSMIDGISTLPAVGSVPNTAYNRMFRKCSSLTTAPTIAASTSVSTEGMYSMFSDCTSLTVAPVLHFTSMSTNSCAEMFKGCTSLNEMEVNFTDWNVGMGSTTDWVSGVPDSGTFTKPTALDGSYATNKVPYAWTTVDKE